MKKKIVTILIIVMVAAVWFGVYRATNAYYDKLNDKMITRIDEIGVMVEFGENKMNKTDSSGYSIRVDGVEFYDFEDYCDLIQLAPEDRSTICDMVAAVTVTLYNADNESTEAGVLFTELLLHTNTTTFPVAWDLLQKANPVMGSSYGICLLPGTSYQIVVPFGIYETLFDPSVIAHPENLDLWLAITSYPVQKSIRVQ